MADELEHDTEEGVESPRKRAKERADALRWRSALEPVGLSYPVVAVKFSTIEPADLPRLSKRIAFCEKHTE